jgi:hypothetical protein
MEAQQKYLSFHTLLGISRPKNTHHQLYPRLLSLPVVFYCDFHVCKWKKAELNEAFDAMSIDYLLQYYNHLQTHNKTISRPPIWLASESLSFYYCSMIHLS